MGISYKITPGKTKSYSFEMGPVRPPSEGQSRSLLIRATRNCPWNRCQFCNIYKGQRFGYRSVDEIKDDIDVAGAIADEVKRASWGLGYGGVVSDEVVSTVVRSNPEIYSIGFVERDVLGARLHSLVNVSQWLASGGETVFLQDANTLIMRTPELIEVIRHLKETLPTLDRVTSYGRSKTAAKKTLDELKELYSVGLSRLHMGLESGCNEVLEYMQKGVTAEEHIEGGRKVMESGISLSEYVMPGLGGREWSEKHILETARVLNQVEPDYIRIRSLVISQNAPLCERVESGEFQTLADDETVDEVRLLIENLNCKSYVVSDHITNLLDIEGQLPGDKGEMLEIIDRYRAMSPMEKLRFGLQMRLHCYLGMHGVLGGAMRESVQEALESIEAEAPDARAKAEEVTSALKGEFV